MVAIDTAPILAGFAVSVHVCARLLGVLRLEPGSIPAADTETDLAST